MLINLILLAIVINLEPTRIGMLPILLTRQRPVLHLVSFLVGSLTVNLGFGILILFVFHTNPVEMPNDTSHWAQMAVGLIALLVAIVLYFRWQNSQKPAGPSFHIFEKLRQVIQNLRFYKIANTLRHTLWMRQTPWFAGLAGVGVGLPSPDYLAVLVSIATSDLLPLQQLFILLAFVFTGSLVIVVPLVGLLFSPVKTIKLFEWFSSWLYAQSPLKYAVLLAAVGCLLMATAISSQMSA